MNEGTKCIMNKKAPIGYLVKQLDRTIGKVFVEVAEEQGLDEVTIMHGRFLGYLEDHRNENIFQKDLEKAFGINRSSVTQILKLMEKKGYIERNSMEQDARLKKVELTELGRTKHLETIHCFDIMEKKIRSCVTKEQYEILTEIIIEMSEKLKTQERGTKLC